MILDPLSVKFFKICKKNDYILLKPVQILYQILGKKSVKSKVLTLNSRY